MKTVELFAGIGGFRVAVDHLGWRTVWANDLCPKACTVYRDRFGAGELSEGDFGRLKESVPPHEVLTAGFPCQPFSSAGKKEGVRDARGTLFQGIVDVLEAHRPRFFVLENVKRLLAMEKGCHFATILGALARLDYVVEWRLLNAMHFGLPQNRERIFLIGALRQEKNESRGDSESAPVRLASAEDLRSLDTYARDALFDPDYWKEVGRHRSRFPSWGLAVAGRFFAAELDGFSSASPLVTLGSVLEPSVSPDFDFTEVTRKWVHANRPVNRFVNGVEILSNQRGGARMGYTIFGINGVAPTLTSTTSRHYERYRVGDRYRRLTNVEYARIQGFPDEHCRAVSIYDQYALFGNAVPPPMVRWVLGRLACDGVARPSIPRRTRNPSLLDYAS
jgi:DNA (cytosine-5)-methyltransferase 1